MAKHLIVGNGEVGTGLYKYLLGTDQTVKLMGRHDSQDYFDVLHICFPYDDAFKKAVVDYRVQHNPQLTVIYSTVPVGTTQKEQSIYPKSVVHSPVEGTHPNLYEAFQSFVRIVGFNDQLAYQMVKTYLEPCFPDRIHMVYDSRKTELMKLLSTGFRYPAMIALASEQEKICKQLGLSYSEIVTDYDKVYNAGYQKLGKPEYNRSLLKPLTGKIGGHCVKANMAMLEDSIGNDRTLTWIKTVEKEAERGH